MICVPNANMMLALGTSVFHLKREGQKVPRNFHQFLTNGKNKESLIAFFFSTWSVDASKLGDTDMFFAYANTCHLLQNRSATKSVSDKPELH